MTPVLQKPAHLGLSMCDAGIFFNDFTTRELNKKINTQDEERDRCLGFYADAAAETASSDFDKDFPVIIPRHTYSSSEHTGGRCKDLVMRS